MSKIKIQSMTLLNFKGVRKLEVSDFSKSTNIYGANGTGKTTVFDAFTWLLFGKDSHDNAQFEIKTLDSDNNVIPQIDHEVTATIDVDGDLMELKRVYREKWTKKRGASEAEFTGHETLFFWNDVPLQKQEYESKIKAILDEKVFKLITNPLAFNSLNWKDQRKVLVQMVGDVSDAEIASGDKELEELLAKLSNKTLDEYKKQVAASRKKANDELKLIPSRIDEVERSKPEPKDYDIIEAEISVLKKELASVDEQISDASKAHQAELDTKIQLQNEIHELKKQRSEIKFEISEQADKKLKELKSVSNKLIQAINEKKDEAITAEAKLRNLKRDRKELTDKIDSLKVQIQTIELNIDSKRKEWNEVNEKELALDEADFCCPTCKREYEADDVEAKKKELTENFNTNKRKSLELISSRGKAFGTQKKNAESKISDTQSELDLLNSRIEKGELFVESVKSEISKIESDLEKENSKTDFPTKVELVEKLKSEHSKYRSLSAEINQQETALANRPSAVDDSKLKEQKSSIQVKINQLNADLSDRNILLKADTRTAELQELQKSLAQEIADVEKEQFLIERFTKLKVDTLENKINERFSMVRFKMFDTQINGAEVETCKALIDGVPFSDANTASKINAGIDIINTLSDFYKVSAPIFIDNRESVVELLEYESQIINLIVSDEDKTLRVEAENKELVTV